KLPAPGAGSPGGRDHFGNHNVMVLIGKNIKSSVIGGVTADSKGTYVAAGINAATGAPVASGGDIDTNQTQVSAARTLGAALGLLALLGLLLLLRVASGLASGGVSSAGNRPGGREHNGESEEDRTNERHVGLLILG